MKALIVYGSKHGSTRKIAEELSAVLTKERFEVRIANARENLNNVADYDVVIVGSAIQARSWLREAKLFMRRNEDVLKTRSVWLFSSGLRPEDPRSVTPKVISVFNDAIGPKDHRFFPGSFDPSKVSVVHRAIIKLPGIRSMFPVGDFRDWNDIRSWGRMIAESQAKQVISVRC
jgi:menaquinone-dependent protoporphyrinogen oxidase